MAMLRQGEFELVEVNIPAGTEQVVFELHWDGHWGRYPTNDLDLYLEQPDGTEIEEGVTGNSPERVVIDAPAAGVWTVLIDGFTVRSEIDDDENHHRDHYRHGRHEPEEDWKLAVTADGVRLEEVDD